MNFNVTLDKEQMNEIASITADKVLATVKYQKNNEDWYTSEIKDLKLAVSKRDSMLVQKDLCIERLRERIKSLRNQLKENSIIKKLEPRGDENLILNDIKKYIPTDREDIWSWVCYIENELKSI